MYTIRAIKGDGLEYSDMGSFRSKKRAKEILERMRSEITEDIKEGWSIKVYMGIHQFVVFPPEKPPVIYFITPD